MKKLLYLLFGWLSPVRRMREQEREHERQLENERQRESERKRAEYYAKQEDAGMF